NKTLHGSGQARDALACPERLREKGGAERTRQSDAEHHSQAADLVLESDLLPDQLLASDDQQADGMCRQGLHMNRFEEAGAGQMRQPTCIIDPPPPKWSTVSYGFALKEDPQCRGRVTSRKRSSPSCGRLTF